MKNICIAALIIGLSVPNLALGQEEALSCAVGSHAVAGSVIWTLPPIEGTEKIAEITFVARAGGEELFQESYSVRTPDALPPFGLPVWLGGIREDAEYRDNIELGRDIEIEIHVDGRLDQVLSLTDLLKNDLVARAKLPTMVEVLTMVSDVPPGDISVQAYRSATTDFQLSQKSLQVCPGVDPDYCDIRFDLCIDDCQGSCYQQCQEDWEDCMFGSGVFKFTTKDVQSITFRAPQVICGWYPWYKVWDRKLWDEFGVVWLFREYERQVCPTKTYTTLLRSWTQSEFCYLKTGNSCSSGSYLGGFCRL